MAGDAVGRVQGKVAIVTGGAKGLGEADARILVREGAHVVIADIDEAAGERLAFELGPNATFVQHDVRRETAWRTLIADAMRRFGRLDVLVNNAGVVELGTIENTTEEAWRFVMAVSADGAFFGCKHAVPAMRAGGGGSIINMASLASLRGEWNFTAYCAAKGAVESLTRAVAVYCAQAKLGIRCNSLHPSGIDTPMLRETAQKLAAAAPSDRPRGPMPVIGAAADVANAVLFLASDESRFINGQQLSIDNGISAASGIIAA
jgi:3(or 17)beta-hydroxysteroid dehydrogenase